MKLIFEFDDGTIQEVEGVLLEHSESSDFTSYIVQGEQYVKHIPNGIRRYNFVILTENNDSENELNKKLNSQVEAVLQHKDVTFKVDTLEEAEKVAETIMRKLKIAGV